jgi:hypothetical protein
MRRNSHSLLAAVSAALAAVLLIAGGLLLWGSAYVHNTVQGQLAAQQITFPPAAAFAHAKAGSEITPNMIPSVSQYAGQQLLTGQQAEAYADHFIAQHITDMSGGKTYSQLAAESLAQPNNTQLAGQVSQITYIISLAAFGLGTVSFLAGLFGFTRIGRERPGAVVFGPPAIEQINEAGHEATAS